jgi:hypothetical protein
MGNYVNRDAAHGLLNKRDVTTSVRSVLAADADHREMPRGQVGLRVGPRVHRVVRHGVGAEAELFAGRCADGAEPNGSDSHPALTIHPDEG